MPRSSVEKEIRHKRTRKGSLVPLLEDLFHDPVEIETQEDVEWITSLLESMLERGRSRAFNPLYSPSQLAGCLRHVYLLKHRKEHGIPFNRSTSTSAHYYFFNGNFLHLKWQYACYKLEQRLDDPKVFKLLGTEVPIISKHKDHGGTVDVLCAIYGEPLIVDFKGLNVRAFQEITRGYIPAHYTLQVVDYGMLYNAATRDGISQISAGLLVSENKGGVDPKHPLALHESRIDIETRLPEARGRLKELRTYGRQKEIPPAECVSRATVQFKSCPFRKFCNEEVREVERERARASREDAKRLEIAVPSGRRRNNSRRNSKRRG